MNTKNWHFENNSQVALDSLPGCIGPADAILCRSALYRYPKTEKKLKLVFQRDDIFQYTNFL